MNPFAYARATNLEDACQKMKAGALLKAGGIDLLGRMKRGTLHPELLVDLGSLDKMEGIDDLEGDAANQAGWDLGALLKLADLAAVDATTHPALAGLREAALNTATPQIRNRATLAGNLLQSPRCWYLHDPEVPCESKGGQGCPAMTGRNEHHAILGYDSCPVTNASNLAPVLCALDARLVYRTVEGKQEEERLHVLYTAPGKKTGFSTHRVPEGAIVTAIRIPRRDLVTAHVEIRHKKSYDWPLCSAAVALRLQEGKIAEIHCFLGSVAPTPHRARFAEGLLMGKKPGQEAFAKAAARELTQAKPLSEGAYKAKMSQLCLTRALEEAWKRAKENQR